MDESWVNKGKSDRAEASVMVTKNCWMGNFDIVAELVLEFFFVLSKCFIEMSIQ